MKPEEHIQFWLESAAHDLDAAESLFAAEKYDWCLFLGHPKAFYLQCSREHTTEKFNKIKEMYQWLKSRITSAV